MLRGKQLVSENPFEIILDTTFKKSFTKFQFKICIVFGYEFIR